jgi:hypothetical protein
MVHRGYIVAATGYPGLRTAGPHPYLVSVGEGRAVLDSVRADAIWRKTRRKSALRSGATRRAAKRSFMPPSSRRAMPPSLNWPE